MLPLWVYVVALIVSYVLTTLVKHVEDRVWAAFGVA